MIISDETHRTGMRAELDVIETTRQTMVASAVATAAAASLASAPNAAPN